MCIHYVDAQSIEIAFLFGGGVGGFFLGGCCLFRFVLIVFSPISEKQHMVIYMAACQKAKMI